MGAISVDHVMLHQHRSVSGGSARAAVFGVSDGLVSNVALVLGVAAAGAEGSFVLAAGASGLVAGAFSMAAGEYVSMRAQQELIERELDIEERSIRSRPEQEQAELTAMYVARGLSPTQAEAVAAAVHADPEVALDVHAREELGVIPGETGNPTMAATSSFAAFAGGAALPLLPWLLAEGRAAAVASIVIGLVAAISVGGMIAHFTGRPALRTAARQVAWATVACAVTVAVGLFIGAVAV